MRQRHHAVLGQFRLAPVGDGDLRRALHVHAAVVGRERVAWQATDHAAALRAADPRAPAIELECLGDVHAHRERGIGPDVFIVVRAGHIFLEGEILHRIGLGAVRNPRQVARHRQADVSRIFRLAQRPPRRIFRTLENLGQVPRISQLLP